LEENTRTLVDGKEDESLMERTIGAAHEFLDNLLFEIKVQDSLVRARILSPLPLGPVAKKRKEVEKKEEERLEKIEKENKEEYSRRVEEIKMLDDIPIDPLSSLKN
jgi:hypothetical protein